MRRCFWLLLFLPFALPGDDLANAAKGARILEEQRCNECHKFGRRHPSGLLAKLLKYRLTPSRLTGAIWSHAPKMWSAIQSSATPVPMLDGTQGDDLLVWFAAAGYYDLPGDSKKGAKAFTELLCVNCHKEKEPAEGSPISTWINIENPVALFEAMWRHAPSMKNAMEKKTMHWPSLSSAELSDIVAYVLTKLERHEDRIETVFGDPEKGRPLVNLKGCTNCHFDKQTRQPMMIIGMLQDSHSFGELAAILWNHAPMMTSLPPSLSRQEIADLTAFLWTERYFEEAGSYNLGKADFEYKKCNVCHPKGLSGTKYSAPIMLSALWKHTPAVLVQASQKGIEWPRFDGTEMADLIAYLNGVKKRN